MLDEVNLLKHLYDRFNARDMESVLAAMDADVIWANGMEGGHVHGRDGVRSYWTRQWTMVDPHVEPIAFSGGPKDEVIVEVHQVVRDLSGDLLADKKVGHVFRIENGLVKRFDIRGAETQDPLLNAELFATRSALFATEPVSNAPTGNKDGGPRAIGANT